MRMTKDHIRGICTVCGVKPVCPKMKSKYGFIRYDKYCSTCRPSYKRVKLEHHYNLILEQTPRPICPICKKNLCKRRNKTKLGFITWLGTCAGCDPNTYQFSHRWTKYKKDSCELCGFVAMHMQQLDVHHIDTNKLNNHVSNLQTLCANCHRLLHIPRKAEMT
jgi:HNH endonuclease.